MEDLAGKAVTPFTVASYLEAIADSLSTALADIQAGDTEQAAAKVKASIYEINSTAKVLRNNK